MPTPLNALLVGHGRMGRLIESLAPSYDVVVSGVIGRQNADWLKDADRWREVDVVIEFSHAAAFFENLGALAALGHPLVIGTTGWQDQANAVTRTIAEAGVSAVVAANFSIGANVLDVLAETSARLFMSQPEYGVFIHEAHHAAKRDAPSGTALALKSAIERGDPARAIDVSSTRAGSIPGTHTVGFDGPSETVTLTHTVRDRATFARGALLAARWVHGRQGLFTMRDVIGLSGNASVRT